MLILQRYSGLFAHFMEKTPKSKQLVNKDQKYYPNVLFAKL